MSNTLMRVSQRFVALIEHLEGFRAKAYKDLGGVLTIGFGHLVRPEEHYLHEAVLTREEATTLLLKDIELAAIAVKRLVTYPLRQPQFDALVSFVFNVGVGAFEESTLLRMLNDGHCCCAVPSEMARWNKVHGVAKAGLIARRNAEIAMIWIGDV